MCLKDVSAIKQYLTQHLIMVIVLILLGFDSKTDPEQIKTSYQASNIRVGRLYR